MRTTSFYVQVTAQADDSGSRIEEAVVQALQPLPGQGPIAYTETGKPVRVGAVELIGTAKVAEAARRQKAGGLSAAPQTFTLIVGTVAIAAPTSTSDAEAERLVDHVEDEVEAGLDAVGRNVVSKFGNGKLSYQVKV